MYCIGRNQTVWGFYLGADYLFTTILEYFATANRPAADQAGVVIWCLDEMSKPDELGEICCVGWAVDLLQADDVALLVFNVACRGLQIAYFVETVVGRERNLIT